MILKINKLEKFQPELVVDIFPEKGYFTKNPKRINNGICMRWAYCSYLMFNNVELWSIPSHAFIKIDKKFYDAERLCGEFDWRDLPATNFGKGCGYRKCSLGARRLGINSFKKFWNNSYYNPSWKWCRTLVSNFFNGINHELMV